MGIKITIESKSFFVLLNISPSYSLSVMVNGLWPPTVRREPSRRAHSVQPLLAARQDSQSICMIINKQISMQQTPGVLKLSLPGSEQTHFHFTFSTSAICMQTRNIRARSKPGRYVSIL